MGEMVTSPQGLQQAVEQVKVASTPPLGLWPKGWRAQLFPVWVITRREIHDTMRDWRLMVPIVLLTLVFPVLLNFIARFIMDYFGQYTASIIGEQAIPLWARRSAGAWSRSSPHPSLMPNCIWARHWRR
jgi:hypothetical protein